MPILFYDLEFVGDDPRKEHVAWDENLKPHVLCYSWAVDDHPIHVEAGNDYEQDFLHMVSSPDYVKVTHSKTEGRWLGMEGYEVAGLQHDTMVMSWLRNENTDLDLEWCAMRYAKIKMDKRINQRNKRPWFRCDDESYVTLENAPIKQLMDYNGRDVEATRTLYYTLRDWLQENFVRDGFTWWDYFLQEEVDFTRLLLDMELRGMPIDLQAASRLRDTVAGDMKEQEQVLEHILGYSIKWSGRKDLQRVLFDKVWYQDEVIPHGLDLRKATIVTQIAEDMELPKSKINDDAVASVKQRYVKGSTPAGFMVQGVTPQNLKGYWTRRGRGLRPLTPETESSVERRQENPELEPEYSTATPDLLTLHSDDEFVRELVKWRKYAKVINTYLDVYPKKSYEGRLYGRFNQTGTKTGRLSSSGPNLENQPAHGPLGKGIRSLFRGRLIVGDYSQLEPRLMAHFSGDDKLTQVYTTGQDVYLVTGETLFGEPIPKEGPKRQVSKTVYLGSQYGAGALKLMQILALAGWSHAQICELLDVDLSPKRLGHKFLSGIAVAWPGVHAWKGAVKHEAHIKGYVSTLSGRRRHLKHNLEDKSWKNIGYGERQAVNAEIQGSAGDIVRRCMLEADLEYPWFRQLNQVHDEVVFECDPDMNESDVEAQLPGLKKLMEEAHGFDLSVPLVFDVQACNSWADKGLPDIELEWVNDFL